MEHIKLNYGYADLEPVIDALTMEIHHGRHHATYVANYNGLVEGTEFEALSIEEVLGNLDKLPADKKQAIINNGGGAYNHNVYFEQFTPGGSELADGELKDKIVTTFGSVEEMLSALKTAGATRFGSGWSWLVVKDDELSITQTLNQDTVLDEGYTPLITIDVWEHAYYLKHQNKRPAYLDDVVTVLDWKVIEDRYTNR
ncbi:superoxide dismutase [Mollicutes bacterium LVI A0078]|nr:superoxide dismutase [Mollicutes bacterium LVI A0075]WOO91116.1 superoxide dismutase [Mollicutes bacterium LVI A0078]